MASVAPASCCQAIVSFHCESVSSGEIYTLSALRTALAWPSAGVSGHFTWIFVEIPSFREHCTHSVPQKTALAGHRDDCKSSPEHSLEVRIMHLSRKKPPSCGEVSAVCTWERYSIPVCVYAELCISLLKLQTPKPWSHHLTKDFFEIMALYSLLAIALASSCGRPCAPQVRSPAVHCECSVH